MGNYSLDDFFPLASHKGGRTDHINTKLIQELSKNSAALTMQQINEIIAAHRIFLENGGDKGKWYTMLADSLVIGIYTGIKVQVGKQADFSQKKITGIDFSKINLATANFIGSHAENIIAKNTNFYKAIFTDAYWIGTNFEGSDLSETDFSRGNFSFCNFKNCNLQFADFENCNLTGADFTGANLSDSRFPGAILDNVVYISNSPSDKDFMDGAVQKK